MDAWFDISELQSKVGTITDRFNDYIELKEVDRGEYYIVHERHVRIILNTNKKPKSIRKNIFY
jgi:hypothetical protein